MRRNNFFKNKKKQIFKLIEALLAFLAVVFYLNLSFYNIIVFIFFFIILKWFLTSDFKLDKKLKHYFLVVAIILSIFLGIGNLVSRNLLASNIGFLNISNLFKTLVMILGFIPLIQRFLCYLFSLTKKIKITPNKRELTDKKLFLIIFLIIISLWFILFLRFFPAIMTPDSYYVVHNVLEGILSDHHTFGHTWFFAPFFKLGQLIFHSINGGVAVFIIFQMFLMALIYTLAIRYFAKKGLNKWICLALALFIGINPLYSRYSVTLWRDILFGMSFLVLFITLYDYVINNFQVTKLNTILFTIFTIIMLFFRNNGIFVFIFMVPFIVLIGKPKRMQKIIYSFLIISLYFVIKGPVFSYFNIEKGKSSEAYSIPIQQISRVLYADSKISIQEEDFLNQLYDTRRAKKEYDPTISDKMKETINNDFLEEHKLEFFKVWFTILLKHPNLYFEAYFTQTLGYWYPDVQYWATGSIGQSFFEPEFKTTPLLPARLNNLIDKTIDLELPFSMLIFSIGLYFFMLIISTALSIYRFGKKHFLYYCPFYCLWFTMMIATPVFAELRYIFGLFATMPFLILIPFMEKPKIK